MVIKGCQEGKATPRLSEVKCPKCGQYVEVFVIFFSGFLYFKLQVTNDFCCAIMKISPLGGYEIA